MPGLCREAQVWNPPAPYSLFLRPWHNTEVQNEACQYLKAEFDQKIESGSKKAIAAGGAACITSLQATYYSTARRTPFEWEADDARRAALSPAVEACTASAEAGVAADKHAQVAVAFHSDKVRADVSTLDVLTEPHRERLANVIAEARAGAIDAYDAIIKANHKNPLVVALYMSAQAATARRAGDEEAAENYTAAAALTLALLDKGSDALRVSISGSGAGAGVANALKRSHFGGDVISDDRAKSTVVIQLTAPKISTSTSQTTLDAEYQVPGGSKPNPAWTSKKKDCDSDERYVKRQQDSCTHHNNPKNRACSEAVSGRKKLDSCLKKLGAIKATVPGMMTKTESYPATEFYGGATGEVTITGTLLGKKTIPVTAVSRSYTHGAVSNAKISARTGRAVTASEMQNAYENKAVTLIREAIDAKAAERHANYLKTVRTTDDLVEAATALTSYALRTYPNADTVEDIDARLEIPTYATVSIIHKLRE